YAAYARAVRARLETALDQTRSAGADRRPDRPRGRWLRASGRRAFGQRTRTPARCLPDRSAGAGRTILARGRRPAGAHLMSHTILHTAVAPEWVDYNGHMNDAEYARAFSM